MTSKSFLHMLQRWRVPKPVNFIQKESQPAGMPAPPGLHPKTYFVLRAGHYLLRGLGGLQSCHPQSSQRQKLSPRAHHGAGCPTQGHQWGFCTSLLDHKTHIYIFSLFYSNLIDLNLSSSSISEVVPWRSSIPASTCRGTRGTSTSSMGPVFPRSPEQNKRAQQPANALLGSAQ